MGAGKNDIKNYIKILINHAKIPIKVFLAKLFFIFIFFLNFFLTFFYFITFFFFNYSVYFFNYISFIIKEKRISLVFIYNKIFLEEAPLSHAE